MPQWTVSNLKHVPHFADIVAKRGWHAWWTESGVPLSDYRAHLEPMMVGEGLPQAFVAHQGDTYLGSALLIESDLDARPLLTPWIAALWVEQVNRGKGIASNLMACARAEAARLGVEKVYLCAAPDVTPYYLARGWVQIEADVRSLNVFEQGTLPRKA
jgi:GNAT superfamily N-acetyltransferase